MMVHADGEFAVLKPLIEAIPGGPRVNLASKNEHVPEIENLFIRMSVLFLLLYLSVGVQLITSQLFLF
jgi:hypothetical protein